MNKNISRLCIAAMLACASTLSFASLPSFSNYYFFGDSLSDAGNFVVPAGTAKDCVNVDAPVTNTTGGTNPGKMWTQDLDSSASASKNGGNDYAVAGYETGANQSNTNQGVVGEVDQYLSQHPSASSSALYVIWGGANDILQRTVKAPGESGSVEPPATVINQGMANITSIVNKLYAAGARHFFIIGMPDVSKAPLVSGKFSIFTSPKSHIGVFSLYAAQLAQTSQDWNSSLSSTLSSLKQAHSDIVIYTWNPYSLLDDVSANPSNYGFPSTVGGKANNTVAICSTTLDTSANPDDYIFFNFMHPTTKTHALIAQYASSDATEV